jgi:DUF4097 and DUF4098 domain-containing protein YvlB
MKDQVVRILKMVQEGRLSPEDAFDLMDAFTNFDENERAAPPPAEEKKTGEEPFRKFVDSIENMTKEAIGGVDWSKVAGQVRTATKKGMDTLRDSVDQISKGEFNFRWFGPSEEKVVELPINVRPGQTVRLERTNGDVTVTGGHAQGRLIVTAKLRGRDKADAHAKAEIWTPVVEESDGSITIRQSSDTVEEDVELEVPEGVHIDVRAQNGDIEVRRTKGSLRIDAKSGDIDAQGLAGSIEIASFAGDVVLRDVDSSTIEIENKSGDVQVSSVKGSLVIRSASGDIRGKDVSANAISVESVSGDIDLDLAEALTGALNARTVSGDVLIDIASGTNCRVSLSSLSGSVSSRVDLGEEHSSEERITGAVGTGDGTLDASSVSGDVRLSWRDHQ